MKTQIKKHPFLLLVLLCIILIGSCRDEANTYPEKVNELTIVSEYTVSNDDLDDHFALLPEDPGAFDYQDFYNELAAQSNSTPAQNNTFSKVTYQSTDNHGKPITLTGLLIRPSGTVGEKTVLLSHNHGTELEKKLAPSQFILGQSDPLKYPEVLIAWSISALNKWVIVMPDYQGMGDDHSELHPYCIKDCLAASTADMVEAAQNTIIKKLQPSWNGNTYIMGYSEGGYVTMTALQELEKRNVKLNGAVIMEGPYDLSGSMLDIMLKDSAFPVPYFLPMMLVAYNDLYPKTFVFDEMLISPYNTEIPKYTTGYYSTDFVNNLMPANHILMDVFTSPFVDTLRNKKSKAYLALYKNDAYIGWKPKTETYMWHCINDDCVPYDNFVKVKNYFGAQSNITYITYPKIHPIFHTIHQTAAPIAFMQGTTWIIQKEQAVSD